MRDLSMLCAGLRASICVAALVGRGVALEHTQDSAQVWGLLTQVRLAHGQLREAEESIRKSLRIDPDNAQCWIGLASVNNRLLRPQAPLEAY